MKVTILCANCMKTSESCFVHVEDFRALDQNVIRATHWSRAIPPPGTRRELEEAPEKEKKAQNVQVQMLDTRGR